MMAGITRKPSDVSNEPIRIVRIKEMLAEWDQVEPLLQRVLTRIDSGHTVDDVVTKIQYGDMQLWRVYEWQALVVTQITALPQHRVLSVVYLAGEGLKDWLAELTEALRHYAQQHSCKYVEAYGRDGWRKPTKPLGFTAAFSVIRLEV